MEQLIDEPRTDAYGDLEDSSGGLPWRDVVAAVFRHRKIVLGLTAVGALIMFVFGFLQPPNYEARMTLTLAANRADAKLSAQENAPAQADRIDDTIVNSEVAWLTSDGLVREVLEPWHEKVDAQDAPGVVGTVVGIVTLPLRLPSIAYRTLHGTPPPSAFDAWVDDVQGHLVVSPVRLSSVINLSYRDSDPEFAAEFLNSLIAHRMKRQTSVSVQGEAVTFYDEQSKLLADRVHAAEGALQAFYQKEGIVGGPEERKELRDRLAEVRTLRAKTDTELAEARVRVDVLSKSLATLPKEVKAKDEPGSSVRTRVLDLMVERSKLLATYAPTSVKIIDLDRQIAEATQLMRDQRRLVGDAPMPNPTYSDLEKELIQAKAQLASVEARGASLQEQEQHSLEQMQKLVNGTSKLEQLEIDLDKAKEAHRTYVGKRESARFSNALDASELLNITVAEPATVPQAPVDSRRGLYTILGGVIGFLLGVVLAYGRDLLDPRVKSVTEVSRLTGMPIIGEVVV